MKTTIKLLAALALSLFLLDSCRRDEPTVADSVDLSYAGTLSGAYEKSTGTVTVDDKAHSGNELLFNLKANFNSPEYELTVDGKPVSEGQWYSALLQGEKLSLSTLENFSSDRSVTFKISVKGKPALGFPLVLKQKKSSELVTYELEVTGLEDAFSYAGGTKSYTVKSSLKKGQAEFFVPWKALVSEDGGSTWKDATEEANVPEGLRMTTHSEAGHADGDTYDLMLEARMGVPQGEAPHLAALQAAGAKGTAEAPHDLSKFDTDGKEIVRTTANCYIIHAPGVYMFPVVYGNALKNNEDNQSAYTSTKELPDVLSPFLDYAAQGIRGPWITGMSDACLVWQDEPNLVSSVSLFENAENEKYVRFNVSRGTINQGNAIVAVRDAAGKIAWSWHIWVTDADMTAIPTENFEKHTYDILPFNLGWCEAHPAVDFPERVIMVKIVPQNAELAGEKTFTLHQKAFSSRATLGGNCPYYQWGRKDPLLPSNGAEEDKACYADREEYLFKCNEKNTAKLEDYIQNPHKMFVDKKGYLDKKYTNLWSAENDNTTANIKDNKVVKTVYDPSPSGYCMPPYNTWTGAIISGNYKSVNREDFNVEGSFEKGWHIYSKLNRQGPTSFYPAMGTRSRKTGKLWEPGIYGYLFTAVSQNIQGGRMWYYKADELFTRYGMMRGVGTPVRPVKEF